VQVKAAEKDKKIMNWGLHVDSSVFHGASSIAF
jgi:hypothetical protein